MFEFELPAGFIDDILAQATQMLADISPIWFLAMGIILATWVIAEIINFFSPLNRAVREVRRPIDPEEHKRNMAFIDAEWEERKAELKAMEQYYD
jgi:hypothetical protein